MNKHKYLALLCQFDDKKSINRLFNDHIDFIEKVIPNFEKVYLIDLSKLQLFPEQKNFFKQ